VELIFEAYGQRVENVYHVTDSLSMSEGIMADIGYAFVQWFNTSGKLSMSSSIKLVKIVLKDMESRTGPAIEYVVGLPIEGGLQTGVELPLNVTAAVSWGTPLRGRSFRGRTYVVGLRAGQVSGNQLTSQARLDLIDQYADLVSAIGTAGFTLVVVSKYSNKAPRTTGIATAITSVNVNIDLDSQRRRLAGRGA